MLVYLYFFGTLYCVSTLLICYIRYSRALLEKNPPLAVATAPNPDSHFCTVFYVGNGADLTQIARYSGPDGFVTRSGIPVRGRLSSSLVYKPWLGENADGNDIQSYEGVPFKLPRPLTYLTHMLRYPLTGVMSGPLCVPNIFRMNIGQEADVARALKMTRDALRARTDPTQKIVMFGTSRGSVVALQVAACLTAAEIKHVGLLVLEGMFDTVPNVVAHRMWIFAPLVNFVVNVVLQAVTEYRGDCPTPIDIAREFPHKDLPTLIVTSKVDEVVPPELTVRMAAVLQSQLSDCKLLVLEKSPHPTYAIANVGDANKYADALSEFYVKM